MAEKKFTIILSKEAVELQKYVSSPIQTRRHVSYSRELLDSYEPNKTFYLSRSILEQLRKLGTGVERGRPAGTYARKMYQRLLIDLSWNSSRLEGNTYSILETERLLETGEEVFGKNPIRVLYRDLIREAVYEVVQGKMNKLEGSQFIAQFARERISDEDRSRFTEIAEIELQSLHKGNFARFKIRPSVFFCMANRMEVILIVLKYQVIYCD